MLWSKEYPSGVQNPGNDQLVGPLCRPRSKNPENDSRGAALPWRGLGKSHREVELCRWGTGRAREAVKDTVPQAMFPARSGKGEPQETRQQLCAVSGFLEPGMSLRQQNGPALLGTAQTGCGGNWECRRTALPGCACLEPGTAWAARKRSVRAAGRQHFPYDPISHSVGTNQ